MRPTILDFYFDYLSPFAFFAWRRVRDLCDKFELELNAHPVVFGKLLDHWGQLGPAEFPPKNAWVSRYCQRYASLEGFEYNPPKYHPFNPLSALRLSLKEVSGEHQFDVIQALFSAGWTQGADLGEVNSLIEIINNAGIDASGYEQKITEQAIKNVLITETNEAIARGVFGVPTMIVGDQLFWGNDQFHHIELLLEGEDPVDMEKLRKIGTRPRKIDRKAIKQKQ